MSNIDKQALREAAAKVNSGEWSYEEFNRLDLPGGAHIRINGRDAIYCLKKPVGGVEQSRAVTAFIAAFNPKVALALLDENLQLQREKDAIEAVALALRDDMRQAREKLEAAERSMAEQSAIVAAAEKLVRCKGRYHSELNYRALAKLFGVITPDLPPLVHENVHYAEAVEVEISALRQRIQELEARVIVLPQRLSPEGYHIDEAYMVDDTEGEYLDRDAVIDAIRAAGIKVKEL
ncbi:ead/Ea22-like family protein [Salmonella enterica]|uniref:Ead/Ea22-like family protein n=2 Tax=Salmonella enterica TaxID=28901 RepID=A0A5U7RUF6_SALER|nr:ead/Ea22-like family protein [Salmonella enterica]EBZ2512374.1 ead/Ea22-like family protein [Salmonella enterica subsp. enterica serovar Cerro]ECC3916056.1 ead/Ea22-like family protein [Salmonella enterica subsp. diarizonae]EDA8351860.1 ead/Ea22-like family protein [Salmonella enterica subsp. enterica serovar Muenchen]EEE9946005.1 ead/Ea22-like family protein [Salmonella enterica subsp. enterica serovar Uzaramo]ELD8110832.1 ead/Ea22-like family protein [Salmonella enterica subsp. enterica s